MKKLQTKQLATGEAHDHHHTAVAADAVLFGFAEDNPLELQAPSGSEVTHEEHKTVTLPPGDYTVDRVKEFDYLKREERRVVD